MTYFLETQDPAGLPAETVSAWRAFARCYRVGAADWTPPTLEDLAAEAAPQ